ncbi:hypothetical protein [uncultured Chitinophaga sp.]|uniref:hypothetical protein n=1 Tax=uncultured Chitinophaga sp. TaxID=339340 RepID=UPI0025F4EA2A|nr:hypothetical protein [uncultured Chitinophaga sp.]
MQQPENQDAFSYEDSLKVITQMIEQAKDRVLSDGFDYMLWGAFVCCAALAQYFLINAGVGYHWLGWTILMPLGAIITFFRNYACRKRREVKLAVMDIYLSVLMAFLVSLCIIIFSFSALGYKYGLGVILVLYGLWIFISGRIFKFTPFVLGAVVNWVGSILVFNFLDYHNTLLTVAAGAIFGYLIPGYLLRREVKMKKRSLAY